ncbi:MAG: hypothetical protein RLZZ242_948 [Bacteroidota bacterium]|jgi:Holliday junction DNA helicase RuvA
MITQLTGKLVEKSPTHVVIDCGGVGYHLEISLHTYQQLSDEEYQKLYTHLQIKEDAHSLFGFTTPYERSVFRLLLSVSGIGANTARTMLSSLAPEEILEAIVNEHAQKIQAVKGIGQKTAQRVIIELRDKAVMMMHDQPYSHGPGKVALVQVEEAIAALEVLGFSRKAIYKVVERLAKEQPNCTVEELIKNTLNAL